jgi:hypothetical protein
MPPKFHQNLDINPPKVKPLKNKSRRVSVSVKVNSVSRPSVSPRSLPQRRPSRFSWFALLVLLLIIIILVGVGYFCYSYFQYQPPEQSASPISYNPEDYQVPLGITIDNSANASADPAGGWQVFNLPAKGTGTSTTSTLFSFKHPAELVATVDSRNNLVTLNSVTATTTRLVVSWKGTAKDLLGYLKDVDNINATAWEGQPGFRVTSSTIASVSGQTMIIREQHLLAADLYEYVAYFKSGNTVYTVGLIAEKLNSNLAAFFTVFLNNFKVGQ